MSNGNSSSSDVESRRRNQPRCGAGKYKWAMQPHHAIQWQKDWLNLAAKIFNADKDDILLTSREKNEVLRLLANRITDSNISAYGRAVGSCKIVDAVRKMCAGKGSLIEVNVYTALLRYSLDPPEAWLNTEAVRQRLDALRYLERCADGDEKYTPEAMKNVMPKKLVVTLKLKQQEGTLGGAMDFTALAGGLGESTPYKLTIPALRPGNRAEGNFMTPTPPSKKRKATSELPPRKNITPPKILASPRKIATPKRTATPRKPSISKNGTAKPVINSSPEKNKSTPQAEIGTKSPTSSLRRSQPSRGVTVERLNEGVDNVLLANIFKATEVLDKVAHYEDPCVLRVALSRFISDLQKAGWSDLAKSAEQLIKDGNRGSRAFLAGMIVSSSYERINDAVDKESESTQIGCGGGPASGSRKKRLLFRSG